MTGAGHSYAEVSAEDFAQTRILAEQGDASAQYNLGKMYRFGQGVPQDYGKAVEWYRKAAEQDHAQAQFNLGVVYYFDRGVPQDYTKAAEWFRKAAEQGQVDAQFTLGLMYRNGQGCLLYTSPSPRD